MMDPAIQERMDIEQAIAEQIELLSRLVQGAVGVNPVLVSPAMSIIEQLTTSLAGVAQDYYDAAGKPYGDTAEGFWRWWNEHGKRSHRLAAMTGPPRRD